MKDRAKRFFPFILTLILVIVDQFSKYLVVKNIPEGTIFKSFFNDFLWICHVRNTGVAFSIGAGFSTTLRFVLFTVLPVFVLVFIAFTVASKKSSLTEVQRWLVAGILGGGIGTMIDRIFRFKSGVVDFISVKFYGLFGMDRWPTFNISDSCVVVFVTLFAISVIFAKEGVKTDND